MTLLPRQLLLKLGFELKEQSMDAEKLIALSERSSSVASWLENHSRGGHRLSNRAITKSYLDTQFNCKKET